MKNKKELVRSLEESVSKGWYCSAVKLAKEIGRSEQEIEEYEARQKAYSKMRQMLRKGYSWKDIGCKLRGEVRNYNSWLRDDAECIAYAELAIKAYKRSAEEGCDSDSKKEGWCGHCWEQATNLDEKVERLKKRMQLDHHKKIEEWAEAAKIAEELEWWDDAAVYYKKAGEIKKQGKKEK